MKTNKQILNEYIENKVIQYLNEDLTFKGTKNIGRGEFNVVNLSGNESSNYTRFSTKILNIKKELEDNQIELEKLNILVEEEISKFKQELKNKSHIDIDGLEEKITTLKKEVSTGEKDLFNYSIKNIFPKLPEEIDNTIGLIVDAIGISTRYSNPDIKIDYKKAFEYLSEINNITLDVQHDIIEKFKNIDINKRKLLQIEPKIEEGITDNIKKLLLTVWIKFKNLFTLLLAKIKTRNNNIESLINKLNNIK